MTGSLDRIMASMSDPRIYPHRPGSVRMMQTHISVVFIAGDLVYKIKKPLNLGFLDFTTLEKRKYFCAQEVRLNSRFSHGVYLGVVPICEDPDGLNLEGKGVEVEAAVLMKRLPEDRSLLRMLQADQVTNDLLDRIADRIAHLHSTAPKGPQISIYGALEVIRQNLRENYEQTKPYVGRTLDAQLRQHVYDLSLEFLNSNRELFRKRMDHGFIRDCHGDLHLDHVIILEDIILVDCIEFNERFRYGDTAADLGFLLMDLEFQGYPAYSRRIARHYAEASADSDILQLLSFYKSYRAFVRGKVLGFALDEPEVSPEEKQAAAGTAGNYFSLSRALLRPSPAPALIIMAGLTGTGKSFLAEKLGKRLGIEPLRSDVLRKRIFGVPSLEHRLDKFGEGFYRSSATERTYDALLESARRSLTKGESVVLDASFIRRRDRIRAMDLARECGATLRILYCTAPESMIFSRLRQRIKRGDDPSDGRPEIYREQEKRFEQPEGDESQYCRQWDSTTDPNPVLQSIVRELMTEE